MLQGFRCKVSSAKQFQDLYRVYETKYGRDWPYVMLTLMAMAASSSDEALLGAYEAAY